MYHVPYQEPVDIEQDPIIIEQGQLMLGIADGALRAEALFKGVLLVPALRRIRRRATFSALLIFQLRHPAAQALDVILIIRGLIVGGLQAI